MTKLVVNVAIALLFHQSKVLVGWRNAEQHQGNKYEFPGGKIEQGETPEQACRREVFEEVGIGIQDWHIFDVISHAYDDVIVNLHLFHAKVETAYLEEIQKPWTWYTRDQLLELNFPKANQTILQRLFWQHFIKISEHLSEIEALNTNYLMYWRVNSLEHDDIQYLMQLDEALLKRLIVNISIWQQLPQSLQSQIFTIHFKQSQVMQAQPQDLNMNVRCIAACHDLVSLDRAQKLGFEAVFLSPVLATQSHPDTKTLGWEIFESLAKESAIPVFALGGLKPEDLAKAQQHHAYGVAGISAF
ncbi:NUDIX domain-containing protein [Acinetobacter defluvii]|uniref:8-oxo-dGTP diphosphatase n=1 Tax=Acinetobacter defluvii TaxID=1871111 RepID=A0A2S2FC73_9GAMM|nr:NUDIX domain-containing protein [Acinetobacter defluvii]AWL28564.1 NUDIX domain-containing protein [Acinetobacter defluvii]